MDNVVNEIRSKLDIVEIISEYIQLKSAGANFRALCPFHKEKTPSFFVSPERQIWHCFGCGEGGDIFSFVMKMEGLDFAEVLRILAKRAGVDLKRGDPRLISQATKVLDILKLAADFYHHNLESPAGKEVLNYLEGRGVEKKIINDFQLGYATNVWDGLLNFLIAKGFKSSDLEAAGLIIKKSQSSGFFDRFRSRLMFPINDAHGNIIGFGGRILKDEKEAAKYINSPETVVYSKGHVLYALDKAKQEIRKNKYAIIVEGYMDVLASHQAGIKNVVASSGTALTLEQIKLLKRYTSNLILGFDVDLAGQEATKRGIDIALQEEMNIKIITLLKGKDPDECIREDLNLWKEAIRKAKPVMEYYFDSTFSPLDVTKVEDKKKAAKVLLPIISKIASRIEQDYWSKELAQRLKVEEEIIREGLKGMRKKKDFSQEIIQSKEKKEKSSILGEGLLSLILKFSPSQLFLLEKYLLPLEKEFFFNPDLWAIAEQLKIYYNNKHQEENFVFDYNVFSDFLKEERLKNYVNFLILLAEKEFFGKEGKEIAKEAEKISRDFKKEYFSRQLKIIEENLKTAEEKKDAPKIEEFTQKFHQIMGEFKKLI